MRDFVCFYKGQNSSWKVLFCLVIIIEIKSIKAHSKNTFAPKEGEGCYSKANKIELVEVVVAHMNVRSKKCNH